jgi:hypothetical protein
MKNTADVTDGKPIAVLLQSISGASDINPLVAFFDIDGGKREVLLFYFVPDTIRDYKGFKLIIIYFRTPMLAVNYQTYPSRSTNCL